MNEHKICNQLNISSALWIQDKVKVLYNDDIDMTAIRKKCKSFYQVKTFRATIKEFILGYIHEHNVRCDLEAYKIWQVDWYADCAWSSIPHKQTTRGIFY